MSGTPLSRRRALRGAATAGLSLPLLAACGGGDETAVDPGGASSTPAAPSTSSGATSTPAAPASSEAATGGLVAGADVPVGGGVVLADDGVVVTQPTAGEFKGFSNVCTHTGCPISEVTTTIDCPCHGSKFDLTTGDVVAGPAPSPLPAVEVRLDGDAVVLA